VARKKIDQYIVRGLLSNYEWAKKITVMRKMEEELDKDDVCHGFYLL
jgi:hypothetical protein